MNCKKPLKSPGRTGAFHPCRQCMACRIDKSREWRNRILIESRLHDHSCFVTLTYGPEHEPEGRTLVRRHVQLFLKKLRKLYPPRSIRYFGVGEYGDTGGRPHYHVCLFGVSLLDEHNVRRAWVDSEKGEPRGFIKVDELNSGTAGYVSQYVVKKWTNGKDSYVAQQLRGRLPEFPFMSLRPGIGYGASELIANAINSETAEVPTALRMDGKHVPLGRYIRNKVRGFSPNEEALKEFEQKVWLQGVQEEDKLQREEAKKRNMSIESYRKELRTQRFLNTVSKHKLRKHRRSL